jgi:lipopolysaccharide biosynthesis protein
MEKKFACDKCKYYTNVFSSYKSHQRTKKHNNVDIVCKSIHECQKCRKTFKSYSGLWRHSKLCTIGLSVPVSSNPIEMIDAINNLTNRIENIQRITNNINSVNIFLNKRMLRVVGRQQFV